MGYDLRDLPNLGETLVAELVSVGVSSADALIELGALEVALRVAAAGYSVCANKLYALEGAIRGCRWHSLDRAVRESLWDQFRKRSSEAPRLG